MMACNRTGTDIDREYGVTLEVEMFLSYNDVRKIDAIIVAGGGAAGVYGGLVELEVLGGALANPYTAIIAGVIIAYMGWIKWSNSGCGVKVSTFITPWGYAGTYVSSQ
jgi:hypothetical protein